MARILPATTADAIGNPGERLLFQRLAALPDDYLVLHSFPWLRPDRWRHVPGGRQKRVDPALGEGEADFVLLHPRLGLLVVEVKGGHPCYVDRQWYYDDRRARPMKDPFEQAKRSMRALVAEVEEKAGIPPDRYTFGFAVAFPMARASGTLPANARAEVLFDARDLDDIEAAVTRAYKAWTTRAHPADEQRRRAIERAILPKLRLLRAVGPEIEAAEATLIQLTAAQQAVALGLLKNPRVVVSGVAGSGKTLLALEYAARRVEAGDRVLLTCFNRHLAAWMRERIEADPRLAQRSEQLLVYNFHALVAELCRRAGVPFRVDDSPSFWADKAPLLLIQAGEVLDGEGDGARFDTIIADEGQDFLELWWDALHELGPAEGGGRLAVFQDQAQALFTGGCVAHLHDMITFDLDTNCRNTRWIARASGRVIEAVIESHVNAPLGERPEVALAEGRAGQREAIEGRLGALLRQHVIGLSQVALIGSKAWPNGSLAGLQRAAGAPLTDDAAVWRKGGGVLCTTARAFKGLEADIVIIYDLGQSSDVFNDHDLYVACTRAKHRLVLVGADRAMVKRLSALLSEVEV